MIMMLNDGGGGGGQHQSRKNDSFKLFFLKKTPRSLCYQFIQTNFFVVVSFHQFEEMYVLFTINQYKNIFDIEKNKKNNQILHTHTYIYIV